ncbi:unnamed protein product [Phyllotreta striolata]|uniref:Potassium channel domain-containing protein n=1 Tax=Phyllotreta striolata TaxID=444603 RepID=A0A9N9XMS4_PHYSR|nr:unnamed protein product [Phyllotreta striolata]
MRSMHRANSSKSLRSTKRRPRAKIKDCCRTITAFMFTQIGLGALVFGYTVIGAVGFMHLETPLARNNTTELVEIQSHRLRHSLELYRVALNQNIFDEHNFSIAIDRVLASYQSKVVELIKRGYMESSDGSAWTFPAALMFCLSVITMIGYGNLVPKTGYGKLATVIYALFGIPLYVLFFLNVGDALAGVFRWFYRKLHRCSTQPDENAHHNHKKTIVPSSACVWLMVGYLLAGAATFGPWERWDFLDSVYFCATSLCKIGVGDFVPGANYFSSSTSEGNQTKLVISYVYIFFGLGLVAMCYNLMREEIGERVKNAKEDFDQCVEDTGVRLLGCFRKIRGVVEEDY